MMTLKQIPPEDRYNQHINKTELATTLLESAIHRCGMTPSSCHIQKLSGGFQNLNYLIMQNQKKRVLRFYSTDHQIASREVGILKFLETQSILAPKVLDFFEIENKNIAVLEFLRGDILQNQLLNSTPVDFFTIGQELAKIHLISLPRAGFIGPNMKVGSEFDSFGIFLKDYILKVLNTVSADRLPQDMRDQTIQLVQDKWSLVLETEPAAHLVHCDFNPKNIMMNENKISGVIDWEFSISGNGYIDIGNFFRFSEDYPTEVENKFITGYQSLKKLSPHWKEISLLMDLGNMASFLERPEDYQKTFHTARFVIHKTLNYFGRHL